MRLSHYLFFTEKDAPADSELISHKLMLRAGMIKPAASGLYSFLPMGYRVLDNIICIVKEEMRRAGAEQLLLPFVQPAELWKRSGRWDEYGEELLRFQDRKESWFVLSPTHEEIITDIAAQILTSYKKLPVVVYQVQFKFRDELRPRGGVVRAKEFLMKDAYSFCQNEEQMRQTYRRMRTAYERIFSRCGLKYKMVEAESGPIGGDISHEFIAPSPKGEDKLVNCENCGYSAKLEKATSLPAGKTDEKKEKPLREVETPGIKNMGDLSTFLNLPLHRLLKTVVYQIGKQYINVVLRGDHQVNEEKLKRLVDATQLSLASGRALREDIGVEMGFVGPVSTDKMRLIADSAVMQGKNFVAGANKKDTHIVNVNPGRDFSPDLVGDIRFAVSGDKCPACKKGTLRLQRGFEVGHLFHLGYKYSSALGACFLDQRGQKHPLLMGCYGIGVSRLPAAIIEQNYDEDGIIWPQEVAPFKAIVIPTSQETFKVSQDIYTALKQQPIEVLWDDREVSAGVKFKDSDLIGIPLKIIVGRTFLREGKIEIKKRKTGHTIKLDKEDLIQRIEELA